MAKRKNSLIPLNNSMEMETRVILQAEEYLIYTPSKITFIQYEAPMANAAPRLPNPDLKTSIQQRPIWKQTVIVELITSGLIKLCIKKYRTNA